MTTTQAADFLGLKQATIRRQISNGKISATKKGRDWDITKAEVLKYKELRRGKVGRNKGMK